MLVLTRKVGETIRIGEDVAVRVLAVRGGQVSLGFVAPSTVRIFREEVVQAVEKQDVESLLETADRLVLLARQWEERSRAHSG